MPKKLPVNLTRNFSLKLLALLTGFIIWLLVTNSDNPIETQLYNSVPIIMVHEDSIADIGKVVEPVGDSTVTVRVRERRSVLNRLARSGSDFYVEADLENITELNTVPLTITCSNAAVTWDEIEISPSFLKVNLEDKVEQAFPVTVSVSGSPSGESAVGQTTVEQGKNILVAGPQSLVSIINQVTAPISVSGLGGDTQLTAALRVFDRNGAALTEAQLNRLEIKDSSGVLLTDRSVNVFVDLWKVRTGVALQVETTGEPAEGYQVTGVETIPKTISLAGNDESMEQLGSTLKVMNRISVAGASGNVTQELDLTATLQQFSGLKLLEDEESVISAEALIERTGDSKYELSLGSIELLNRPKNMKLVFTPADVVSLSIHMQDSGQRTLDEDEIQASIDLSACGKPGNYEIPLQITLPEGYELNDTVFVMVSSSELPEQEPSSETQSETQPQLYIQQGKGGEDKEG